MEVLGDFSVTIVENLYPWNTWRDDFFKVFPVSTRLTLATKDLNGSKKLGTVLKNQFKCFKVLPKLATKTSKKCTLQTFLDTVLQNMALQNLQQRSLIAFHPKAETGNTEVVGFLLRVPVAGVKKCHYPNKLCKVSFLF